VPSTVFAPFFTWPGWSRACLGPFCGRGVGRDQGGGDETACVVGLDAAGGGVFGCGVHETEGGGDQPLPRQVATEGSGALSPPDEGLHPTQDGVVNAADALRGEFTLRGQQDVTELVDDQPGGRNQPGERVTGVATGVGGVEDQVGALHGSGQDGVNELGAGLEVTVEGDAADARGCGDVADTRLGIPGQAAGGRVQNRRDVAPGVGPLRSRGWAAGIAGRHPRNSPFLNTCV
jgi:hypothetical protein